MRLSLHPVATLLALLFPAVASAQVVVNEIMYTPASPEPEWIELYNAADTAVNLAGWIVHDRTSARPAISNAVIQPGDYFVLTTDTAALLAARVVSSPRRQLAIPALNNTGDDVVLRDPSGRAVDSVAFRTTWGGLGGMSLERVSFDLGSNDASTWGNSTDPTGASPGRRNSNAPPAHDLQLRSASFDPDSSTVEIVVLNKGTARSDTAVAILYHDVDGDSLGTPNEEISSISIAPTASRDSITLDLSWSRALTVEGEAALIAIDYEADERPADNTLAFLVREKFVDTGVAINEIMFTPAAPEPEWVELVNRGRYPVQLAGWTLHDAGASRPKLPSVVLSPGELIVIARDSVAFREAREIAIPLVEIRLPALNNSGDQVVLKNSAGATVDSVAYRSTWGGSGGASLERREILLPALDSASWGTSIDPTNATPGRANSLIPPTHNLSITQATFDPEPLVVDLTIVNEGREAATDAMVRVLFDADGDGVATEDELLSSHPLPAIAPDDSAAITVPWPRPLSLEGEIGIITLAFLRDERADDDTTRFAVRMPTADTGVVVNELMYDPLDPEPEWIEIFNRGERPADLTGWRFEDASGKSAPLPGLFLLPGTYLVVTPDTVELLRARPVLSGLVQLPLPAFNNTGDRVLVRNARGIAVDSFRYAGSWGGSEGASLERKSPLFTSVDSASWTNASGEGATPGAKNSWEPIERDLALTAVRFDAVRSLVHATVANRGEKPSAAGEIGLYHDADGDTIAEGDEKIGRMALPPIAAGDSTDVEIPWGRVLMVEGERGIVVTHLANDQRPGNDGLFFIARLPAVDTGVVVNEIMYDPLDPEPEWIEILNRGDRPVDLAGWRFEDASGKSAPFPARFLMPEGYLVVTPDTVELLGARPVLSELVQLPLPAFNNTGDRVVIRNARGIAIDSFYYARSWGGSGGASLERKDPFLNSRDPASWTSAHITTEATPGARNSWEPILHDLAVGNARFDPARSVVLATLHNLGLTLSDPSHVRLHHDTDNDGRADADEEIARHDVPSIGAGDSIEIEVFWTRPLVVDGEPGILIASLPGDQRPENDTATFTPRLPVVDTGVAISEIMYDPASPEPEWIEIYNRGTSPVDLSGWTLRDGSSSVATISSALLPPDAFLVITGDSAELRRLRDVASPVYHVLLPALNNGGDRVALANADGEIIDELRYESSWGGRGGASLERRSPFDPADIGESWGTSVDSTGASPGRANSILPVLFDLTLAHVGFDPDSARVELLVFNNGLDDPIDAEAVLYYDANGDGLGGSGEELTRMSLPVIPSGDTAVVHIDWPRTLAAIGEPAVAEIAMPGDQRPVDNRRGFVAKGRVADTGVVINEIMFAPRSAEPEWVELYNAGTLPADLTGWAISDAGSSRTLPSSAIEAGGYVVLVSDTLAFKRSWTTAENVSLLQLPLPLFNNGEDDVVIRNDSGAIVDSLHYVGSWGASAGRSLERRWFGWRTVDSTTWGPSSDTNGATPGRANAIVPPRVDLALDSIVFDPASGILGAVITNTGRETAIAPVLILFHDANGDATSSSDEELSRLPLPDLPRGAHRFEIVWPRELTDRGERGLLRVDCADDDAYDNDTASAVIRRAPLDSGLIITEIMFDPVSIDGLDGAEYIEVFNPTERAIPLEGWIVEDAGGGDRLLEGTPFVPPGGFAVVAGDTSLYLRFPYLRDSTNVAFASRFPSLNLGEDVVLIRNPRGAVVDSLRYSDAWHWDELDDTKGVALERLSAIDAATDPRNWSSSVAKSGGTPGAPNSRSVAGTTSNAELSATPESVSPDGNGFQDFSRIGYSLPLDAARLVVSLYDRHGRLVARPINNEPSPTEGSFIWGGTDDDGHPLPIGPYLLRLEAHGSDGGVVVGQVTVVVAR